MLDFLIGFDRSAFQFLNGMHTSWMDPVMFAGTRPVTWIPLYLLLLIMVVRRFGWKSVWVILCLAAAIAVSDQLSNLVKEWVARPRPTQDPDMHGVHTVRGYLGGMYGFYSAHASTSMAIAVFLLRLPGRPLRRLIFLLGLYVLIMSYTRIYLGVHYPGDILAGWIAGCLIGWAGAIACGRILQMKTRERK